MNWSPELKKRYNFALSSFSRMYGTRHITMEMMHFSYQWANSDNNHPEETLTHIDFYFRDLWTKYYQLNKEKLREKKRDRTRKYREGLTK